MWMQEPMGVSQSNFELQVCFWLQFLNENLDQTPLHIAASVSNCREMAMTIMLQPNVQPHLINNSKETAADIARRTGLTFPVFEMAHSAFVDNAVRIDWVNGVLLQRWNYVNRSENWFTLCFFYWNRTKYSTSLLRFICIGMWICKCSQLTENCARNLLNNNS